jgi:hypothetical protein
MDFQEHAQFGAERPDAADTASEAEEKNAAQATKDAIVDADEAVRACDNVFTSELAKAGQRVKMPFERAMLAIYAAYCKIEANDCGPAFLAERKVKIHGNTKNACYPYLLAFTKSTHELLRDRVCKQAEVVALARYENVEPENFTAWLKDHPIEAACAKYRSITRDLKKSQRIEQLYKMLFDPKKYPEKAPPLPATPLTSGCRDIRLGVLDFTLDTGGDFRVLGVLPLDADTVLRIVSTAAGKPSP